MQSLITAKKYGYITLFVLLATIVGQVLLSVLLPENLLLGQIYVAITTLALTFTYLKLMKGISVIAQESENDLFIKSVKQYTDVVIATCGVLAFYGLAIIVVANATFTLIATLVMLIGITLLGVVSLRISKGFESVVPTYGRSAAKAAYWHKIAGWLIVTVLLNSIGILLSLIADYYMWRVINERIEVGRRVT